MRGLPKLILVFALAFGVASANEEVEKIEYLLTSIGESGCTFIRNGKEYSASEAESHLRMKYRRGKKWANDAETFIERIASKSSFSGKPYRIRCGSAEPKPTSEWLSDRLAGVPLWGREE